MAKSKTKSRPYAEMGRLLERWRQKSFKSALSMFRGRNFSFSYSAYANFEGGMALPSIEVILELTQALGTDAKEGALLWARLQMPTEELRELFSLERAPPVEPTAVSTTPPRSLETTWVLGPTDMELIDQNLWAYDIALCACLYFPDEVPFPELMIGEMRHAEIRKILKPWIDARNLIVSSDGVRARLPHVHMPTQPEWDSVRKKYFLRSIRSHLEQLGIEEESKSARGNVYRQLTPRQTQDWIARLQRLQAEFLSLPFIDQGEHEQTFGFAYLFGPRVFRKKF